MWKLLSFILILFLCLNSCAPYRTKSVISPSIKHITGTKLEDVSGVYSLPKNNSVKIVCEIFTDILTKKRLEQDKTKDLSYVKLSMISSKTVKFDFLNEDNEIVWSGSSKVKKDKSNFFRLKKRVYAFKGIPYVAGKVVIKKIRFGLSSADD